MPRGTKFSELEDVAGAMGDEMARQLIEINVQEQADDWPEEELGECPVCGGAARKTLTNPACSRPRAATSPGKNESPIAPAVGGLFPLRIKRWALIAPA